MRRSVTLLEKFSKKPEITSEQKHGYSMKNEEEHYYTSQNSSGKQRQMINSSDQLFNEGS